MDERDLFIGDAREVDLDLLVVAEIDNDSLIAKRLCQPENPRLCGIGIADDTPALPENDRSQKLSEIRVMQ